MVTFLNIAAHTDVCLLAHLMPIDTTPQRLAFGSLYGVTDRFAPLGASLTLRTSLSALRSQAGHQLLVLGIGGFLVRSCSVQKIFLLLLAIRLSAIIYTAGESGALPLPD